MPLLIRYRSGELDVTERVVSGIEVEPPNLIHAYCHLRGEGRSFAIGRIEYAVDTETGAVISDIWEHFGLPSARPQEPRMPAFVERPNSMTTEAAQALRKADKQALFRRFRFAVIAEAHLARLWASFGHCCFRCRAAPPLDLDHHVPQYLGGRLVPGNIVLLCARCNLAKRDKHPRDFYSPDQLAALSPILQTQLALFAFRFDWDQWRGRPREYLLSLGVPAHIASAALSDPEHPLFVGRSPADE